MDSLSLRDEQFCQAVAIEGLTLLDAYIRAYEPQTEKKTTLSPKASRLAKSEAVRARIGQLKRTVADELTEKLSVSKEQVVSEVLSLARTAEKPSDQLKAYSLLSDLLNFKAKQEIETRSTSISLTVSSMTASDLYRLIEASDRLPVVIEN
jgi:hypothetical protein